MYTTMLKDLTNGSARGGVGARSRNGSGPKLGRGVRRLGGGIVGLWDCGAGGWGVLRCWGMGGLAVRRGVPGAARRRDGRLGALVVGDGGSSELHRALTDDAEGNAAAADWPL
jgi:hypothetical protein